MLVQLDRPGEFIQDSLRETGAYEPGVSRLVGGLLRPGELFFDVGANLGVHSLAAAAAGARVHAFEPVPRLAARAREHARLNGLGAALQVFETAVADHPGEADLYVAERWDD